MVKPLARSLSICMSLQPIAIVVAKKHWIWTRHKTESWVSPLLWSFWNSCEHHVMATTPTVTLTLYMWPRTAKPAKSRWTAIQDTANFRPMGCYTALSGFFTDYSSRMFISHFPANKITVNRFRSVWKSKIPSTILRLLVHFFSFFKCVFLEIVVSLFFLLSKSITFQQNAWWM